VRKSSTSSSSADTAARCRVERTAGPLLAIAMPPSLSGLTGLLKSDVIIVVGRSIRWEVGAVRRVALGAGLLATVTVLAACSSGPSSSAGADDHVLRVVAA